MTDNRAQGNGQWATGNGPEAARPEGRAEASPARPEGRAEKQGRQAVDPANVPAAFIDRQRARFNSHNEELRQLKLDINRGRAVLLDLDRGQSLGSLAKALGVRAIELRACVALFIADARGLIAAEAPRASAEFAAGIRLSDGSFADGFRGLCDRDRWSDREPGKDLMARAEVMAASNLRQPRLVPDAAEHVDADDTDIAGELQIRRDEAVRTGRLDAAAAMPRRAGGGW